ncbi:MAG TPA: arginine--tRNA ligase, partial [Bacillota bacterium]|nr:arginine--tRNA ligase [Bacillota bacterium]
MEKFKVQLAMALADELKKPVAEVREMMETPPNPAWGDIAIPCFPLAKALRKAPQTIAVDLAQILSGNEVVEKAEAAGGYVNVTLRGEAVARDILSQLIASDMGYGEVKPGDRKTVVIDFSSPNIAKPFGIGHLRTTVIGHSIARLYSELGYRVERVNHLGDWGTQFGKLIVAYKMFANNDPLTEDPISTLYRIYVEFHSVADDKPELEEEARLWFRKLEQGDAEARRYWQWFIDVSMREYQRVYDLLGIDFDHFLGESFYEPMLESAVAEIEAKGLARLSDGALIVELEEYGMPPCLLRKSDGATLYATRDIAAALYRDRTYDPELLLYVVGQEQILHFRQLKQVLQLMGEPAGDKLVHVPFGMFKLRDGRMSTRRGKMIFLEDVLAKSIELAAGVIAEKNPELAGSEEIARQVGVGAVVFGDLKNGRIKDVVFDWEEILNFDGETGPYVQ